MAQLEVVISCPADELRQALSADTHHLPLRKQDGDRFVRLIDLLRALNRSSGFTLAIDAIDATRSRVLVETPRTRQMVLQRHFD
jgi:hypothetical protein